MSALQSTLLSNALLVLPLAAVVLVATRLVRQPSLRWALWGLVLLKFVTPAVVPLPVYVAALDAEVDRSTGFQGVRDATSHSRPGLEARAIQLPSTPIIETAGQLIDTPADAPIPAATFSDLAVSDPPSSDLPVIETSVTASTSVPVSASEIPALSAPIAQDSALRSADEAVIPPPDIATASSARLDWRLTAWSIWLCGSAIVAAVALWRIGQFRQLLRAGIPLDPETTAMARELAGDLGLRRLPELRVTTGRIPPLVWAGLTRAMVLLPRDLLAALDEEGRRTLLAHELAHLARRDHWTRRLELAVRCLYWWHPIAWWAGSRLREAEEQCCDARVVALLPESAAAYARTILSTVEFLTADSRRIPTLATGLQPLRRTVRPLHRRLTMIVNAQPARRSSRRSRFAVLALAACILPTALVAEPESEEGFSPTAFDSKMSEEAPSVTDDDTSFRFYLGLTDADTGDASATPAVAEPDNEPLTSPGKLPQPIAQTETPPSAAQPTGERAPIASGAPPVSRATLAPAATLWPSAQQADQPKPQALTSPDEYEEIVVTSAEYELPHNVATALQKFLKEVQDGFPILAISFRGQPLVRDSYGAAYGGMADYGSMGMVGPGKLRILAPAAAQETLKAFLMSMQSDAGEGVDAEKLTLVRAEYQMSAAAAKAFADLLESYQQSGKVAPLFVKTTGTRLSITTRKEIQDAIRKFIIYLSENWQTAAAARPRAATVAATKTSVGPNTATSETSDSPQDAVLLATIKRIDNALEYIGRDKILEDIAKRGVPVDPESSKRTPFGEAEDILPLLRRERELMNQHGPNHPDVIRIQKVIVILRAIQLARRGSSREDSDPAIASVVRQYEDALESEYLLESILEPLEAVEPATDRAAQITAVLDSLFEKVSNRKLDQQSIAHVSEILDLLRREESLRSDVGVDHREVQALRSKLHEALHEFTSLRDKEEEPTTDYFDAYVSWLRSVRESTQERRRRLESTLLELTMGSDDRQQPQSQ